MKLSKKTLAALSAATALVVGGMFTACSDDDDENADGVITVESNKASVNYDNTGAKGDADAENDKDTNPSVRRFATADVGGTLSGTDHYDSIVQIEYKAANGSPMGYIFGLTGDGSDNNPYNFGIVGIRVKNNVPQYYVSFLRGITGSSGTTNMIEQANFGVSANSTKDTTVFTSDDNKDKYFEYEAKEYTNIPGTASTYFKDGTLSVVIDIRAISDGSYSVAFYKDVADALADRKGDKTNTSTGKDDPFSSTGTRKYDKALGTQEAATIPATVTATVKDEAKASEAVQARLAYYVNILPTTKVEGTWTVSTEDYAVTAADEVVEE